MSKVVVFMSMSLDGFVAAEGDGPGAGLGVGGEVLHAWLTEGNLDPTTYRPEGGVNAEVFDQMMATGAVITGRHTFEWAGEWGGDHHDGVPVYVLTRTARDPWGVVRYVTDVRSAAAQATAAAGDRDVMMHGATAVQAALRAGVVDEMVLTLVPVLLGRGTRLFDDLPAGVRSLRLVRTQEGEGVLHLRYEVDRSVAPVEDDVPVRQAPTTAAGEVTREPQRARSADGTEIAYDVYGTSGPLVAVVGGATTVRADTRPLAEAIASRGLTVINHDRRGRGDSGDTSPYDVQREVEDLAAVIGAVRPGEKATVIGFSSGAALVLRAAAAGAPIVRALAFEPPYRVEGSPPLPDGYTDTLEALVAGGRPGDAYEFFLTKAVGLPQDVVDGMKDAPVWEHFCAIAPTLAHDGHCLGGNDHSFPTDLVAGIEVPVLALGSTGSPDWLVRPAEMVAETAPRGRFEALEGDFHTAPDDTVADAIVGFIIG